MLENAVYWIFSLLFLLLSIASIIVYRMCKRNPEKDYGELILRVKSWWWMIAIFFIAVTLHRTIALIFFGLLSFLALKEYLSLVPTRRADRRVLFWAYLSIPFQFIWISMNWYGMFIIFIPVYAFLLIPIRMLIIGETHDFLRAIGSLHWGLMTTVFSLSHIAYLFVLPETVGQPAATQHSGAALVLFLVLLTQLNDVSQYVWGKNYGRRKVIPKVSPNKTVEGLIGGVATCCALSMIISPFLTPLTFIESIAAGLIIGIGGFIGDVTISALKRDLGVKDTGSLIPGHGGILDRLDSLTYTAPLFFHFIYYFHY